MDRPTEIDASIDEATAESFPASDAPGWSALHAGGPAPRPWAPPHPPEVRATLRTDLERLARPIADREERRSAREDVVAKSMLEAGRSILREPIDPALRIRNVESELLGLVPAAPPVIVAARYDGEDVSGIAMLLAVVRGMARPRTQFSVKFVAFAEAGPSASGGARMAAGQRRDRRGARVMVALSRLDLQRGRDASITFAGNLRSGRFARSAASAFRQASRIRSRSIALPAWLPGFKTADQADFWRLGFRALSIGDGLPWRLRDPATPDVDHMAGAVPGLVAAVIRLAGGRGE